MAKAAAPLATPSLSALLLIADYPVLRDAPLEPRFAELAWAWGLALSVALILVLAVPFGRWTPGRLAAFALSLVAVATIAAGAIFVALGL